MTDATKFIAMIAEIQEWADPRITKEWNESFGHMVLITAPRQSDPFCMGNVTGLVHPDETRDSRELLEECFALLCVSMLKDAGAAPVELHELVMLAAAECGYQIVSVKDDDEEEGMISN